MFTGIALFFILAITGYLVILPLVRRGYTVDGERSPDSDEVYWREPRKRYLPQLMKLNLITK